MTTAENFKEAFSDGCGSIRGRCACGVEYYNPSDHGFDPGEYEALICNDNAHETDGTVSFITFEGRTYVVQCGCWKKRAERLAEFIDSHAFKIAAYLRLEKRRKEEVARQSPTVDA